MTLIDSILLGILQGLTEFLPISSSGHLVIVQTMIKGSEQPGILFDVTLHLGTLLAVLIYFKKDILDIIKGFFSNDPGKRKEGLLIIIGTIPTGIIGLVFKGFFEKLFHSAHWASVMLIVTGTLLFAASRIKNNQKKEISRLDAIIIGIAQGISIIPGISRSGATICTAIFRNVDAEAAGRFSFILSIPAIIGAVILEGRHMTFLETDKIMTYLAGAIAAMIVGVIAIQFFMNALRKNKFSYFAYYCWTVGTITFFML